MDTICRSVIDIGTNSVKLLVAEIADGEIRPVWEESRQTRLGQGFYQTHQLRPQAIAMTAKAVADFAETARLRQSASILVIATSAARDAANAPELTSAVEQASGLKVEILTGDAEAELVFQGVITDPRLVGQALLLLDVGGGSTEFIFGLGEHTHFRQSFPLGTVRLMEMMPPSDPPESRQLAACRRWLQEFLASQVAPRLEPALRRETSPLNSQVPPVRLIGTGGTTSILASMEAGLERFDRARIEATLLSRERLRGHVEHLWSLPLEQRKQLIGLPKNRADIMLMGAVIYEAIVERFGFPELGVSTRGLRFGALIADMATAPGADSNAVVSRESFRS